MFNSEIEFICKGISNYLNLQKLKLNLTGCSIHDQGMERLSGCLIQFTKLNYLDLNVQQNKLGEKSGNYFSDADCSLKDLNFLKINLNYNQIFTSYLLANSIKNVGYLNNLQELQIIYLYIYSIRGYCLFQGLCHTILQLYIFKLFFFFFQLQIQVSYKLVELVIDQHSNYANYLLKFFEEIRKCVNLKIISIQMLSSMFKNQIICHHFTKAIIQMSYLKILRIVKDKLPTYLAKHKAVKKVKRLVVCQH
ncbi:hypothetical protein ABPG72_005716 [Tetrahymena utriculariae]